MPSLMNGLSALGAGVAQFAGAAGLELQKAQLANQTQVLADQLATTRETKLEGQRQTGQQTLQTQSQAFQGEQGALNRASTAANIGTEQAGANTRNTATIAGQAANTAVVEAGANTRNAATIAATMADTAVREAGATHRNDATIAAAAPEQAERILAQRQQTAFSAVQTRNAQALQDAHTALQAETVKPDADPTKIAALKSQVTSLETSASTEAAITGAAAAMYRTDMDAVQHYNTQLVTATAALNSPDMSDTDKTAQKGLIANLKTQLAGAQRALEYSSGLVHGRVGTQTGNAPPAASGGTRPPLASFGGAQTLPSPNAGPRAAPPATLPGLMNGGY